MARERLNAIDVGVVVANLRRLALNYSLVNIYDITNRIFVLKFSKNEAKVYVLIEIGCRIHTTQFLRSSDRLPSNFNVKLRKHLRSRKLRNVAQMSQDRVIDFTFSSDEYAHHLIVQLFLPGNIYLTDANYKVLTVLRPQNTGDHFFKVGTVYQFDEEYNPWCNELPKDFVSSILETPKTLADIAKQIYPSVHASLVEFILKKSGVSPTREFCSQDIDLAMQFIDELRREVLRLTSSDSTIGGYLFKAQNGEYDDFSPFEIKADGEFFADYNDALDTFFTRNEIKREEKKVVEKKPTKLKKIKLDQDRREGKLIDEIKALQADIEILQNNIELVDNCLNLVRTLIATGASWKDIQDQIEIQKTLKHPIAQRIAKIDIPNQIMIFSEAPNSGPEIEYGLSCHQNLEKMYSKKKKLESKLERTKIGREFALKKVNKEKEKEQVQTKGQTHKITTLRKRFWFEKFYWFITSDGYLVLGGRDALQNEILVKKYLTKGDLYFHADIHGASSCILKNPGQVAEIPQTSIDQGGCFAVCHSNAWNQKFMVPSWWVHHHQVSKTPPTGEFVPQGSFVIRGKKNYIQPQKLEMGLAVVFHIGNDDEEETAMEEVDKANDESLGNDDPLGDDDSAEESEHSDENLHEDASADSQEDASDQGEDDESEPSNDDTSEPSEKDEPEEDEKEEVHKPSVRIDPEAVTIAEIECDVKRSTKQRRATGYPKALEVDLESIKTQLGALNLLADPQKPRVRIEEPEKLAHTPEASRKIRERIPTGANKKQVISKSARNKLAKMKKKYGSDDEETQELRRLLTGSTKLKAIKQAEEEPLSRQNSAPRPRTQPSQDTLKTIDDKELEQYMKQFSRLCKDPKEDDIILNAIPMCAPFSALQDFKTKVKLVPGNTKKGVIASQSLHQFTKSDEKRANYIKLITTDQLILTMIGNCKVPTNK